MNRYYCDGSQHRELNKLGIGIISKGVSEYIEVEDFVWKEQVHEIHAMTKAVEMAVARQDHPLVIYNDDKFLVADIQKCLKQKNHNSNYLKYKRGYEQLIHLLRKHRVTVETPQTREEKTGILRAHHLSRSYMKSIG